MSAPIRVCFVCLGNICRSPTAEAVFLDLIEKKGVADRFVVDSAGTGARSRRLSRLLWSIATT